MKRLFAVSGLILAIAGGIHAAPPIWWSEGDPPVIDPQAAPNNHGVANIGQTKWMAKSALEALRVKRPDLATLVEADLVGSGKPIVSWAAPVTAEQQAQQRQPLLIGQLKAIAAPFYDRLQAADSAWLAAQATENGLPSTGSHYPWTATTTVDANKAMATIGQLKAVFSLRFENLSAAPDPQISDRDEDWLPDAWEVQHGLDPNDNGGDNGWDGDFDNDGVSNGNELLGDGAPNDPADFPVQVIQIMKGAGGYSNMIPYEPPSKPYSGRQYSGAWWTGAGYVEVPVTDAAMTPAYLTPILDGIVFPATPPAPLADRPGAVRQSNLALSNISSGSHVSLGSGGGIETGLTTSRVWIKAPAVPAIREFTLVKQRYLSAHVDATNINATSFVSAEVVNLEIPVNEMVSNSTDIKHLPTAIEGSHVFAYENMLCPMLFDEQGAGSTDDRVIEPLPPRGINETQNDYLQRALPDRHIAFIEPHRGTNNSPDMPRLVAALPGATTGLKVRWRLEVEYLRGNGYRADYVQDFTRPEDKVLIPEAGQGGTPVFTAEMEANEGWRIFESQGWQNEIQRRGFFGGTGKLYMWLSSQTAEPTEPVITFRIGGKNPDQSFARQFIDQAAGAQFWYAYAIARHETFGRVRTNGQIRFYNQFYTDYQGGPIGDASVDMGWAAWAKGWPLYNLDRDRRSDGTRYQNGPGGYGMYQLTWGPKHPNDAQGTGANAFIPRRMIWNWQDNANGAIAELQGKVSAATALRDGLVAAYPQWPTIPNEGHLSGLEAIIVTFYNGTAGLPRPDRNVNGGKPRTPWTGETRNGAKVWQFHQNSQNYVRSVNAQINNIVP